MYVCSDCQKVFDEPETQTWSDPGDYPSGAGSGPLPSYDYNVCPHCGSSDIENHEEDEDEG